MLPIMGLPLSYFNTFYSSKKKRKNHKKENSVSQVSLSSIDIDWIQEVETAFILCVLNIEK